MAKKVGRPAKILKGGLSNTEKGRVVYLLGTLGDSEESYVKIAEDLKRPLATIKKCVKEIRGVFVDEKQEKPDIFVKKQIIRSVLMSLIQGGITKVSANAKINRVLSSMPREEQEQLTENQLYMRCLRLTNAGDLMINQSAGGRDGIAIMTKGASERNDESRQTGPPKNPNIYKIFDDE